MLPIELISHIARPVSLSMRLMGNIVGDHKLVLVFFGIFPLALARALHGDGRARLRRAGRRVLAARRPCTSARPSRTKSTRLARSAGCGTLDVESTSNRIDSPLISRPNTKPTDQEPSNAPHVQVVRLPRHLRHRRRRLSVGEPRVRAGDGRRPAPIATSGWASAPRWRSVCRRWAAASVRAAPPAPRVEGISRNPQASNKIFTPMILGLALIESLVIYGLVIAFLLYGKIG